MRTPLATIVGLGLLAALPAHAGTGLKLTCITRDLPPGAHVWMEVQPLYHSATIPTAASQGEESSVPEEAIGEYAWQFEVPAGELAPISHDFTFPVVLDRTSTDHFAFIDLKTRFKIDIPGGQQKAGYGEVHEVTFGMPVPPGKAPLSRCLRLRQDGDKLIAETAADCRDTTFASLRRGDHRLQLKPPGR